MVGIIMMVIIGYLIIGCVYAIGSLYIAESVDEIVEIFRDSGIDIPPLGCVMAIMILWPLLLFGVIIKIISEM